MGLKIQQIHELPAKLVVLGVQIVFWDAPGELVVQQ